MVVSIKDKCQMHAMMNKGGSEGGSGGSKGFMMKKKHWKGGMSGGA
jgi:hypothetical protein